MPNASPRVCQHTVIALPGGTVWSWGANSNGQLGDARDQFAVRHIWHRTNGVDRVCYTNAVVRYTITGASPTEVDPIADPATPIYLGNYTLTTKAFKTGADASGEVAGAYDLRTARTPAAVVGGRYHSIALRSDGTVLAWGMNSIARLAALGYCYASGVGWIGQVSAPVPSAAEPTGIVNISAGEIHTVAVNSAGSVLTWGENPNQQLGHELPGTACGGDRAYARPVPGLPPIAVVSAGDAHNLALSRTGLAYGWGKNAAGQLGNGSTTTTATPALISSLADVTKISAGFNHSLAVTSDGSMWSWGGNSSGALGTGSTQPSTSPVRVTGLSNPHTIAAGYQSSYAVLTDGSLWGWGQTAYVAGGTTGAVLVPTRIEGLPPVQSVAPGRYAILALGVDGRIWSWGSNAYGMLGDGSPAATVRNTPAPIPDVPPMRAVSVAVTTAFGIAIDGSVWAWGTNDHGKVGDGSAHAQLRPIPVMILAAPPAGSGSGVPLRFDPHWTRCAITTLTGSDRFG